MTAGSRRGLITAETLLNITGLFPNSYSREQAVFLCFDTFVRSPAFLEHRYEKSRKSPLSLPFSIARSLARRRLCLSLTALALIPRISPIWGFLSSCT